MIIFLRRCLLIARLIYYRYIYKMNISTSARVSFGAKLDTTYPKGIHIGNETFISSGAIIFTHDFARGIHKETYIGDRCFVGANAIIMCGVRIGNEVLLEVGA